MQLLAALAHHAERTPNRPFLLFNRQQRWTQFSFADALEETQRWAGHLAALRLPEGALLCIALPHSPELYFVFLGAMRAGLVPAFLAVPSAKQRPDIYWSGLQELLERSRPGGIVVAEDHLPAVAAIAPSHCAVLSPATLNGASGPLPAPPDVPDGRRLALVQHSSGTTGAKKGVALTFEQIRRQVDAYARALDIGPQDRIASWLPLYHDMGLVTGFLLPLTLGLTVVSLDAFEWTAKPLLLFEAIELVGATLAWLPNFAFAHLVRVQEPGRQHTLGSMRAFISCSEPCKPATNRAFLAAFASSGVRPGSLLTCYAMAETVFATTQSRPGEPPAVLTVSLSQLQHHGMVQPAISGEPAVDLLSCGLPIEGMEVAIRFADGQIGRTVDRLGEVVVRGDTLFGGYHGNSAASAAAFDGSWFRTGDLGFLHGGELYVTGRLKDVIIVHGRNFYAHDIEQVVGEVAGIRAGRVAAFAQWSEASASEGVVVVAEAMVEDQAAHDALRREVRKHVSDRLDLSVRSIELCSPGTLVKTTSGKVSRAENARLFAARERDHAGCALHG